MDNQQFDAIAREVFAGLREQNHSHLPVENVDVPIMDAPIWGFAAADDPIFQVFKQPEVVGESFRAPKEWMPEAKTVVVFYFSFSEEIRSRHRVCTEAMSEAFTVGYGEHAKIVVPFARNMTAKLEEAGVKVFNPTWNMDFPTTSVPYDNGGEEDLHYNVAWSTRHVAYAAGLGTFGIHRHIITEKGCCGAMVTLLLDCALEPTKRTYSDPYEYCSKCGAFTGRCPVNAITMEHKRNLKKCSGRAGELFRLYKKGNCAKCMVGVPCEDKAPGKKT